MPIPRPSVHLSRTQVDFLLISDDRVRALPIPRPSIHLSCTQVQFLLIVNDRVRALPTPRPSIHLSCTQVHFLLIIEDRVCYLRLIGKRSLLVPSRLHYCDDSCFTRSLFANFTQCPWVALLQRSCCREIILFSS